MLSVEKWDSITRTWRNHLFLFGSIDLLLIDEIHLVGEDRGATLEMVVVRMQMLRDEMTLKMSEQKDPSVTERKTRIIAISATFPNLDDVATWMKCEKGCHEFSELFRPVPLITHVVACGNCSNPFVFDKTLDSKISGIIRKFCDKKQSMVFCASKASAENLATKLSTELGYRHGNADEHIDSIRMIADKKLRDLVIKGSVAYHHS